MANFAKFDFTVRDQQAQPIAGAECQVTVAYFDAVESKLGVNVTKSGETAVNGEVLLSDLAAPATATHLFWWAGVWATDFAPSFRSGAALINKTTALPFTLVPAT